MGRTLTILLFGFAVSFGILAYSRERRMLESVDRVVNHVEDYSTKNTAVSGAYMVLNRLYQNPTWRTGYSSVFLGTDSLAVTVEDNSDDVAIAPNYIRITSSSYNAGSADTTQVMVFDGAFQDFALWAKGSATDVSTNDSLNNADPGLLMAPATSMPEINKTDLADEAAAQGNVHSGLGHFHPSDNYPNSNFYYVGVTPNVTHVYGDLHLLDNVTLYGIFIVEGNVIFDENTDVRGILYLPNSSSMIYNDQGDNSDVLGGIVTWGTVDGNGDLIRVQHWPTYMRSFMSNYAPSNLPMRVIAWK